MMLTIMVIYGVTMTAVAWYAIWRWRDETARADRLQRAVFNLASLNAILINGEKENT